MVRIGVSSVAFSAGTAVSTGSATTMAFATRPIPPPVQDWPGHLSRRLALAPGQAPH